MAFHLRFTRCSSERDPEMPATIAPLQDSSSSSAFNHHHQQQPLSEATTSNLRSAMAPSTIRIAGSTVGIAQLDSPSSSVSFNRKPLNSGAPLSKMSKLFKTGNSPSSTSTSSFSHSPSPVADSDLDIRHRQVSQPSDYDDDSHHGVSVATDISKPCQLRFWCPKPSKSAIFNKMAAHQHTPPPQVLRQRDCLYDPQLARSLLEDDDDDEDEEDDDYSSSSEDDDDCLDEYDLRSDEGLASRLTTCSDDDDDCIFNSD